jgi:hypothetical protein
MNNNPSSPGSLHEGRLKLIALLMYVADQKQKSLATMEQLFSRLRLPLKG